MKPCCHNVLNLWLLFNHSLQADLYIVFSYYLQTHYKHSWIFLLTAFFLKSSVPQSMYDVWLILFCEPKQSHMFLYFLYLVQAYQRNVVSPVTTFTMYSLVLWKVMHSRLLKTVKKNITANAYITKPDGTERVNICLFSCSWCNIPNIHNTLQTKAHLHSVCVHSASFTV